MPESSTNPISGLLAYFTRHRTAANLLLISVVMLGLAAYPNLRSQFFPDSVFETVRINVEWEGAGASDIDEAVVQVILPGLQSVEGVIDAQSTAFEARAAITLEFEEGWDMRRAVNDTQAAVDAVTLLPTDVEIPEVEMVSWSDRVTDVVITGPVDVELLGRLADELTTRLFERGVARVAISGVEAPRTVVELAESDLLRHQISLREVAGKIGEEAKTDPSGEVGASARVRAGIAKRAPDQIENVVVRSNPDGSKLLVGDVATVYVEGAGRGQAFFVGDHPAVSMRVTRSERGDAIEIQSVVEEVVAELKTTLPENVTMELVRTRSEAITGRLQVLYSNGLVGLLLVIGLLYLFLNARVAFWVAAGIPTAICAAFALFYAFGLSINMLSLFGLIITLGIVVDDAIVVGEHADFRRRHFGESADQAATRAAISMSGPVFAATLTTVIAFFGLTVIGGRFGNLIVELAFAVVAILIASLLECFLILPNHLRHALANADSRRWYDWPSNIVNRGFNWVRDRLFRPVVAFLIVFRYPVVAVAFVLLAIQAALFISGDVRWRFFNAPELGSVNGNFAMAPSAERADTHDMMRELQRAVQVVGARYEAEFGLNPVAYTIAGIGGTTGRGLSGSDAKDPDQLGTIIIELIDADLRPYSSFVFLAALQDEVRRHPLLETLSFRSGRFGPGGDALEVKLAGAEAAQLKLAAEDLKAALIAFPEVSAVEDDLAYDKDELVLELTPQGRALGFTIDNVGSILRDRLGGVKAASFPDGVRTGEIWVQLHDSKRSVDFLDRWSLETDSGHYVPLSDIVTVTRSSGFSTIRRDNGVHVVTVSGDISEDNAARAAAISESLQMSILPEIAVKYGVIWSLTGLAEDEREFLGDAVLGAVLVLTGIYLVIAWVFSSWTRPLIILLTIPFGLVGAIWGHYVWSVPLSMFSVIGLVGMSGIIINDSIILLTTIDKYSAERGIRNAIRDAVADRLRPVLLTTLTTVVGLIPLLYETSQQASFLKPTVITLVYGLGFGMFLVLFLVPSMVAIQTDTANFARSLMRALRASKRGWAIQIPVFICMGLLAGWFAASLGYAIWTGSVLPLLAPYARVDSAIIFGLAAFSLGAAVICLLSYALGVVWIVGNRTRSG